MNSEVDRFFAKATKWKKEMEKLRKILLSSGLTEEFKWGKPCYSINGSNVVVMAPFKETCALIVCKGALLKDPKGILIKPGEHTQAARQIRFTDLRKITEMETTLRAYMLEAIVVEKAGLEVKYKTSADFVLPEELQKQLDANPALKSAFTALTPGRQRAYIIFISGAKQSMTREARVAKCSPAILKGKGLND